MESEDEELAALAHLSAEEREEVLVQSAMRQIAAAQERGDGEVDLSPAELEALEMRRVRMEAEAAARRERRKKQRVAVPLAQFAALAGARDDGTSSGEGGRDGWADQADFYHGRPPAQRNVSGSSESAPSTRSRRSAESPLTDNSEYEPSEQDEDYLSRRPTRSSRAKVSASGAESAGRMPSTVSRRPVAGSDLKKKKKAVK